MDLPRLYPILDTAALERRGFGVAQAARIFLQAGSGILQYRHKGFWSQKIIDEAAETVSLCRAQGATAVINDRVDLAMLHGAGVHLGQQDLPPHDARALLPEHPMGFSTHNEGQIREAAGEPVDYIAIGPIFQTESKEQADVQIGVDQFRAWRMLTAKPVVAIGGITRRNARQVLDAGATSLAVIADLLPEVCNESTLKERIEEWQQLVNR